MKSEEDDFTLSGLTQNTFLPNRIILDDELSIIASTLGSENLDFVDYKESTTTTSPSTSHPESTNKRNISFISDEELHGEKERKPNPVKHQT